MTVLTVGFRDGLAYAGSDAGRMDEDGRLVCLASKQVDLVHLNMVVTCFGSVWEDAAERIACWGAQHRDPRACLRALPQLARDLSAFEQGVRTSFAVAMFDRLRKLASAWIVTPDGADLRLVQSAIYPSGFGARWPCNEFDPHRHTGELFDEFRQGYGDGGTIANGWGEMTIVSERGIERTVVVNWNDELDLVAD